jgi:hypothetical protein
METWKHDMTMKWAYGTWYGTSSDEGNETWKQWNMKHETWKHGMETWKHET